jgi:hypothetical protein
MKPLDRGGTLVRFPENAKNMTLSGIMFLG